MRVRPIPAFDSDTPPAVVAITPSPTTRPIRVQRSKLNNRRARIADVRQASPAASPMHASVAMGAWNNNPRYANHANIANAPRAETQCGRSQTMIASTHPGKAATIIPAAGNIQGKCRLTLKLRRSSTKHRARTRRVHTIRRSFRTKRPK